MKRLSGVLFAVGALLALASVAAACGDGGGDDERALEEYFQEIEQIADDYVARFDAVEGRYQQLLAAAGTDDQQVLALLFFLEASSLDIRGEIDARDEVDPPPGVEKAHLEWLTAARVLAKIYEDVVDRAPGVQTSSGLQELFEEVDYESRLAEAEDRAGRACFGLQEIADENEIEVNLCPR
jgi:hypothetical protein